MNNQDPEIENGTLVAEYLHLDLEALIEQIFEDLQGTIKRSTIERELGEVIPVFASARIRTYVPIFVRRNVVRRLQAAAPAGPLKQQYEPTRDQA